AIFADVVKDPSLFVSVTVWEPSFCLLVPVTVPVCVFVLVVTTVPSAFVSVSVLKVALDEPDLLLPLTVTFTETVLYAGASSSSGVIFSTRRPSAAKCTVFTRACRHGSYSGSSVCALGLVK